MIYESQNQQPAVNVYPNGGNGGMFGDGAFGGGFFWVIILFFFALMMGWGNNGYASGNGGFNAYPYVQQGFDQAAVINGINSIQTSLANAEVSRCNIQANQTAALNNIAMSLQNCCCENRASVADLKYTVATENCADRAALNDALQAVTVQSNANTQRILDMMCQDKIDAKNEKITDLERQLTLASLRESQTAQNAFISQGFANEVDQLYNRLNSCPVPTTPVYGRTPIFTCNGGCGCGNSFYG